MNNTTDVNVSLVNDSLSGDAINGTKIPATPQGMAVAYTSLFLMAVVPIYIGSFRSVRYKFNQHIISKQTGEIIERMSHKDAALFPVIASCALFGLYLIFKIFSKEYVNLLLATYFFFLGVYTLAHILNPILQKVIPSYFPDDEYHILFTQGKKKKEILVDLLFNRKDLLGAALCIIFGIWYLVQKHWIANNLIGLAFSVSGVEFLQLNSISVGCLLLGGLFVYDIFWVFGTNVMVTVAKSFEAPVKLVFPQDFLDHGLWAKNFAMLGLGDIVIPGIFIAILLRYDVSRNLQKRKTTEIQQSPMPSESSIDKNVQLGSTEGSGDTAKEATNISQSPAVAVSESEKSRPVEKSPQVTAEKILSDVDPVPGCSDNFVSNSYLYFYCGYTAYWLGLGTTIFVMHYFKHAQPALLYLVPFCIGIPLVTAAIKGELADMFKYEDNPELPVKKQEGESEEEKVDKTFLDDIYSFLGFDNKKSSSTLIEKKEL